MPARIAPKSRRCSRACAERKGASAHVFTIALLASDADGCKTRDEGRSRAYDAEERGDADAASDSSPKGRGVSGGLLILVTARGPREGGRPFASVRLISQLRHPIPKRLRHNREYVCRGSLARQRRL